MAITVNGSFPYLHYERLKDGTHTYYSEGDGSTIDLSNKLVVARNSPVLTPIFNKIAHYVGSAKFMHVNDNGDEIENSPYIDLINNPNVYQSKTDFLEQWVWYKLAFGYVYQYPVKGPGLEVAKEIYNLNTSLVEFPDDFKTPILFTDSDRKKLFKEQFVYDEDGQNLKIAFEKIIPYFDLSNGLSTDCDYSLMVAPSRIDSIKLPLTTIQRAYEAKNIVIGSNGRELYKSNSNPNAMPFGDDEQKRVNSKINNEYGFGLGKSRAITTKSDVEWQSLHIVLKELGLDESVMSDFVICVNAFSFPPELLLSGNNTYENQNVTEIRFIQGFIQNQVDDLANSLTSGLDVPKGTKIIGCLDHLPIMQEIENMRVDTQLKQTTAIRNLYMSGYSKEEAEEYLNSEDDDTKKN